MGRSRGNTAGSNEAQTAAAVLGHNFPDSSWYKDAHALLKTGGFQYRNLGPFRAGSWISDIAVPETPAKAHLYMMDGIESPK